MPLGGAACWSRLRIPQEKTLFVAQSDVEAYFFRMGIPEEIGRHFCLPPVPPAVVAACRGVDICETLGHGKWFPYFKVLPMGFSWAFYIVQKIHERAAELAGFDLAHRAVGAWRVPRTA